MGNGMLSLLFVGQFCIFVTFCNGWNWDEDDLNHLHPNLKRLLYKDHELSLYKDHEWCLYKDRFHLRFSDNCIVCTFSPVPPCDWNQSRHQAFHNDRRLPGIKVHSRDRFASCDRLICSWITNELLKLLKCPCFLFEKNKTLKISVNNAEIKCLNESFITCNMKTFV